VEKFWQSYEDLTEKHGTFSTGSLPTGYEMPWNLFPSHELISQQGTTVTFQATVSCLGTERVIWGQDVGTDAIKRALGCAVIMLLPSSGLDEALNALRDVWEFHRQGPYLPTSSVVVRRSMTLRNTQEEDQES